MGCDILLWRGIADWNTVVDVHEWLWMSSRLTVAQEVAGSKPVRHPTKYQINKRKTPLTVHVSAAFDFQVDHQNVCGTPSHHLVVFVQQRIDLRHRRWPGLQPGLRRRFTARTAPAHQRRSRPWLIRPSEHPLGCRAQ